MHLEDVELPRAAEAVIAQTAILMSEAVSVHERWLRERPEDYGPEVRGRLWRGQFFSATQYLRAQRARTLLAHEVADLLHRYGALVLPTTPCVAPLITQDTVVIGGQPTDVRSVLTRMTRFANFTGLPAITVPCGFGAGGMPVGLQFMGRPMDEATVLALARAYEQATPWHERRPPDLGAEISEPAQSPAGRRARGAGPRAPRPSPGRRR
jgi:aspartyl-tRNA(Asn)/glutamyl-tRNA(Gln) amidotransferase subunit A